MTVRSNNPLGVRTKVMDSNDDRLWSVQDVSEYLGVSVWALYEWRGTGYGPPGRLVGRKLRYRPHDVRAWVESLPTDVVA